MKTEEMICEEKFEKTKDAIWMEAMEMIQTELPDISFQTWFSGSGMIPVGMDQNEFHIFKK